MTDNIFSAIIALFTSLYSLHTGQQHLNVTNSTTYQNSPSYFQYLNPTQIQVKLYLKQDYKKIDTENAKSSHYLENIVLDSNECEIPQTVTTQKFDIDGKNFIYINVTLNSPCITNSITLQGDIVTENEVITNGRQFSSRKKSHIVQYLSNNNPIDIIQTKMFFLPQNGYEMNINDAKNISLKILDSKNDQVNDEYVKNLTLTVSDSEMVQFETNNALSNQISFQNSSYNSFTIISKNRAGTAKIYAKVLLEDELGFEYILEKSIEIKVNDLLPASVYIKATTDGEEDEGVVNKNLKLHYSILKDDGNLLLESYIQKIVVKSKSDDCYLVNKYGEEVSYIEFNKPFVFNSGDFVLHCSKEGNAIIEIVAFLDPKISEAPVKVMKNIKFKKRDDISFAIDYKGTALNDGYFTDSYVLKVNKQYLNGKYIKIGAITPKILYPEIYYNLFVQGKLTPGNPEFDTYIQYIYYRDKYSTYENQNYDGLLQNDTGEIYFISKFSSLDFHEIDTAKDKLVILPNKYKNSENYLGLWTISAIKSSNKLQLTQNFDENESNLSYVIGNPTLYNPAEDTIAVLTFDQPDGLYKIENNEVTFSITYPTFFAGKDIFIYANLEDSGQRVGNTYKRTLTGAEITSTDIGECKQVSCGKFIKLYFNDAQKPLQYARFAPKCEMTNIKLIYFTDVYSSCASNPDYGYNSNPITDANGYVKICIYPEPVYEKRTDPDTNQTYEVLTGYQAVTPTCQYNVAEEFPY